MDEAEKIERMIIAVDEDLCIGCGRCVNSCPTNALELVYEKVKLKDEKLCDGFGSCIAVCPTNALYIEIREAHPFDWGILTKIKFEDFIEKLSRHYNPEPIS